MIEQKLFKWIGGKKWLSNNLNEIFSAALKNNNIDTYIEPFAGGLGSFLYTLDRLQSGGIKNVILNDVNSNIINLYTQIQKNYKPLFNLYWKLEQAYQLTIDETTRQLHYIKDKNALKSHLLPAKVFFEEVKVDYNSLQNDNTMKKSVLFLFLMKHSFNGLYRENNKGEYNASFNWKQCIFDKDKTLRIFENYHRIFNTFNIKFTNKDVFELIDENKSNEKKTLFYFDPPYLNESNNENQYNKDHFTKQHQVRLLDQYKELSNVVFSNHYLDIFKDFCASEGFEYQEIMRNNFMNPKSKDNNFKVSEILAARY